MLRHNQINSQRGHIIGGFDGSAKYIVAGSSAGITSDHTMCIMASFKTASSWSAAASVICCSWVSAGNHRRWLFSIGITGLLSYVNSSDGINNTGSYTYQLNLNTTYHVIMLYANGVYTLYVNGVLVAPTVVSIGTSIHVYATSDLIASRPSSPFQYMDKHSLGNVLVCKGVPFTTITDYYRNGRPVYNWSHSKVLWGLSVSASDNKFMLLKGARWYRVVPTGITTANIERDVY